MRNFLVCLSLIVLATACKKNNLNPGRLSISLEDTQVQNSYYSSDSLAPIFNIDTIRTTRTFNLVVNNTGATEIRSIKITSDNQNFEFQTSEIYLLSPGKSNIIRIPFNILHGINPGLGIANVLPAGYHESSVTFTGQVDNGSGYTDVELKAKIQYFVKLMDVSLFSGSKEIDLTKPQSEFRGLTDGCNYAYEYEYDAIPCVLKNTGNTDISLYLYSENGSWENFPLIQTSFLHQGEMVTLNLPVDNTYHNLYLKLCSGGIQTNEYRIMTGQDGNGYIGLSRQGKPNSK